MSGPLVWQPTPDPSTWIARAAGSVLAVGQDDGGWFAALGWHAAARYAGRPSPGRGRGVLARPVPDPPRRAVVGRARGGCPVSGRGPAPAAGWMGRGLCAQPGADPDLWFPEPGQAVRAAEAKAVCAVCPVRLDCLAHALAARERHGIWGGQAPQDRDGRMARRRQRRGEAARERHAAQSRDRRRRLRAAAKAGDPEAIAALEKIRADKRAAYRAGKGAAA